mmetsp:Transcript_7766/g.25802  ORF Transcript_7766/g.25802 Transcript_7766/m.25802 type:complete len:450 (+) Transcript_7766:3-1352(+)
MARVPTVSEGEWVILDVNGGERASFVRAFPTENALIHKKRHALLGPIVGAPYGSCWALSTSNTLEPTDAPCPYAEALSVEDAKAATEEGKSNCAIVDDGRSQKLTGDDVSQMQEDGLTAEQIVERLASNSASFANKTTFSQEKWKRKKLNKHAVVVTVLRPTAQRICEAYFAKMPKRIDHMRFDTLSIMLAAANVHAFSSPLVIENCSGLLVGAVAERMNGYGRVCAGQLSDSTVVQRDILNFFNFDARVRTSIVSAPVEALVKAAAVETTASTSPSAAAAAEASTAMECENEPPAAAAAALGAEGEAEAAAAPKKSDHVLRRLDDAEIAACARSGFSSLILAAPQLEPIAALKSILPLLAPSSPFVVYCKWLPPLAEAAHALVRGHPIKALNIELHESWMREHQVLPSRTHPMMRMSGTGGYLLTGVTFADTAAPAASAGAGKKRARE